jgi:WhiB family redox-sensing transcriptional regulator
MSENPVLYSCPFGWRNVSQSSIPGPKGLKRMTAMDWRHGAACRDIDPEIFFPIGATGPALAQIQAAQAICGTCNVQKDCLEWALETGQDAGIWGGMTEDDRREMRRGARQRVAV